MPNGDRVPVVLLANKVGEKTKQTNQHILTNFYNPSSKIPTRAHTHTKNNIDVSYIFGFIFTRQCDLAKEGLVKNSQQMDRYCEEKVSLFDEERDI